MHSSRSEFKIKIESRYLCTTTRFSSLRRNFISRLLYNNKWDAKKRTTLMIFAQFILCIGVIIFNVIFGDRVVHTS